ncbi:Tektin-1 [Blattella germanica]|nr:Tektin-1 [Blattella germanica]
MDFKNVRKALVICPPPPPRFTLSEWYLNNRHRYRTTEDQQQIADRVIYESDRLKDLIDDVTKTTKTEVDRKLDERVKDTEHEKRENELQKAECCKEEEALVVYKERILDAMENIKEQALKICKKCIILREGRLGIDLAHDDVERELLKEVETIEGAQALLRRALEQTNEQIRLLRSTKYFLDRDNEDKSNALKIDKYCASLQETSLNLSMYHGIAPLDPGNVTKEEWERFSKQFIERAAKEVNNARPLRSYIDTLLKQIIEDLKNQYNTLRLANEMMRTITRLEKAIGEKEGFMALAHTRLGHRAQRPAIELTRYIYLLIDHINLLHKNL